MKKFHLKKQRALKRAQEICDSLDPKEWEILLYPTEENYDSGVNLKHLVCGTIKKETVRNFNAHYNWLKYITCNNKQCINFKKKQTTLKNYGVLHSSQSETVKAKMKNTNLLKFGFENAAQSEIIKNKMKNTNLLKRGVEYSLQSKEVKEKAKQSNLLKFGVEYVFQSEIIKDKMKNTNLLKRGVEHAAQSKEVREKGYQTKKKNNSFNTSKPENKLYLKFCKIYGEENVIRNYKDPRYPFRCDFYIKDFDFFIELQGHWGHGKEPYDKNNKEHQEIIKVWRSKNTRYYDNAIKVWTVRDPKKRKTAKENNLNYLEIF